MVFTYYCYYYAFELFVLLGTYGMFPYTILLLVALFVVCGYFKLFVFTNPDAYPDPAGPAAMSSAILP